MNSDWARLPKHLLDLVSEKLGSLKDYIQFGAACCSWHDVTKDNQSKHINLSYQVPMLMAPSRGNENTWSIFDPMSNSVIEPELTIPYRKRISGSSNGWLVTVNEDFTVTLYKPFSMANNEYATVHLPCLFPPTPPEDDDVDQLLGYCHYRVCKATITADPIANPNDCIVVVMLYGFTELGFIRPAKDTTWTKVNLLGDYIFDVVFHNNEFYALGPYGRLQSFDVLDPCNLMIKPLIDEGEYSFFVKPYLVKSHMGDLLRIDRYFGDLRLFGDNKRITKTVKIFKLDFDESNSKWIEMKSLGDEALFLGDNSSISVLASNFVGCQPNCIYFTYDFNLESYSAYMPRDLGVYNLEDESYTNYHIDSLLVTFFRGQLPIWIVPTFNTS